MTSFIGSRSASHDKYMNKSTETNHHHYIQNHRVTKQCYEKMSKGYRYWKHVMASLRRSTSHILQPLNIFVLLYFLTCSTISHRKIYITVLAKLYSLSNQVFLMIISLDSSTSKRRQQAWDLLNLSNTNSIIISKAIKIEKQSYSLEDKNK